VACSSTQDELPFKDLAGRPAVKLDSSAPDCAVSTTLIDRFLTADPLAALAMTLHKTFQEPPSTFVPPAVEFFLYLLAYC
jgi:hypothetical protein